MSIRVLLFASLAELTGKNELLVEGANDTDQLVGHLQARYPAFKKAVYVIAVGEEIIQSNTNLEDLVTVAFLPPYSGG